MSQTNNNIPRQRTPIARLSNGPFSVELYSSPGWLWTRYQMQIWGDGDYRCYKIKTAVVETLFDLIAAQENRIDKATPKAWDSSKYNRAVSQQFIEVCSQTIDLIRHLNRGNCLESFPGYQPHSDHTTDHSRDSDQDHEFTR
jgi:hypothetical protein